MEDKARLVAVSTLYDMEIKNSYSNIKINENFIKYDLSSIDRSFATEIIYGTIRWKLRIDYLIQKNIQIRIDELSKWVLVCIRTAIYQIFFMDKVPEFAAVNEAVNLSKMSEEKSVEGAGAGSGARTAAAAASFTNGVLRNILRNKEEFNRIGVKNDFQLNIHTQSGL
jgi:16S rRNA (cytosine967-C5)-methyltransferase